MQGLGDLYADKLAAEGYDDLGLLRAVALEAKQVTNLSSPHGQCHNERNSRCGLAAIVAT